MLRTDTAGRMRLEAEVARRFTGRSSIRALLSFVWTWGWIAAAFGLYFARPGVLTALVGIAIVSGRQMALAVLMHDAAHRLFSRNKRTNDLIGNWLCGGPIMLETDGYRRIHDKHHKHTWTDDDPDLSLADHYPVDKKSMARKIFRDLAGISGFRRFVGLLMIYRSVRPIVPTIVFTMLLAGVSVAAGRPEAVLLLWWVPWFTGFSLVLRFRNIAEHAAIDDPEDPLRNTRTTVSNPFARFFLAPHNTNFHLEHHLCPYVPHYRLPALHRALVAGGVLEDAEIASGYASVWYKAMSGDRGGHTPRDFIAARDR